jgi:hypothetical protein
MALSKSHDGYRAGKNLARSFACQQSVCLSESSNGRQSYQNYPSYPIEKGHTQDVCCLITQLVEGVSNDNQSRPMNRLLE